jgi:hypothetical protein
MDLTTTTPVATITKWMISGTREVLNRALSQSGHPGVRTRALRTAAVA